MAQRAIRQLHEKQDGRRWKSLDIPIPTKIWPVLTAKFPMPQKEWDEIMEMLEIMKPAIVGDPDHTDVSKIAAQIPTGLVD